MGMVPIIWTRTPSGGVFDTNGMTVIVTSFKFADYSSRLASRFWSIYRPSVLCDFPKYPEQCYHARYWVSFTLGVAYIILTIQKQLHRVGT